MLIADDDLTSRTMLAEVTRTWGYEPVLLDDGMAAWELLEDHDDDPPRLLLLDWEMPTLDGVDLCRRIRARETADPPYIIMLTIRQATADVVEALENGANDYLTKPFDATELQARMIAARRVLDLQARLLTAVASLAHQVEHDPLTGLRARAAAIREVRKAVADTRQREQPFALAICDIDRLTEINVRHGTRAGDAVIQAVATRIAQMRDPAEVLGRYADNAVLIGIERDRDAAMLEFEQIRAAVASDPVVLDGLSLSVTVRIGATVVPAVDKRSHASGLLRNLDLALAAARAQGGNQIQFDTDAPA
nr:response regulator [Thiocystis violacea]